MSCSQITDSCPCSLNQMLILFFFFFGFLNHKILHFLCVSLSIFVASLLNSFSFFFSLYYWFFIFSLPVFFSLTSFFCIVPVSSFQILLDLFVSPNKGTNFLLVNYLIRRRLYIAPEKIDTSKSKEKQDHIFADRRRCRVVQKLIATQINKEKIHFNNDVSVQTAGLLGCASH